MVRPTEAAVGRRLGPYLVSALVAVWAVLGLALVMIIGLEALTMEERCPVPGLVQTYGEVSWQAWPPGEVCTFGNIRLVEPTPARGVAIVVEIVLGIVLLVLWRRSRRAPDPDWSA